MSHFVRERGPPVHFFARTRLLFQLEAVFMISVLIFTFQLTTMFHDICFDFWLFNCESSFHDICFHIHFFQQFSYNVFSLSFFFFNLQPRFTISALTFTFQPSKSFHDICSYFHFSQLTTVFTQYAFTFTFFNWSICFTIYVFTSPFCDWQTGLILSVPLFPIDQDVS